MITSFKVYESIRMRNEEFFSEPSFKVGDCVISIKDFETKETDDDYLVSGDKYYITVMFQGSDDVWRCKVVGKMRAYYCSRFVTEEEYREKKYNI